MEAMSRNGSKGSEWCGRKRRREEERRAEQSREDRHIRSGHHDNLTSNGKT